MGKEPCTILNQNFRFGLLATVDSIADRLRWSWCPTLRFHCCEKELADYIEKQFETELKLARVVRLRRDYAELRGA